MAAPWSSHGDKWGHGRTFTYRKQYTQRREATPLFSGCFKSMVLGFFFSLFAKSIFKKKKMLVSFCLEGTRIYEKSLLELFKVYREIQLNTRFSIGKQRSFAQTRRKCWSVPQWQDLKRQRRSGWPCSTGRSSASGNEHWWPSVATV